MHTLTKWFIRNPVAANLLMILILFMGTVTFFSIRIEGFPKIPPESVVITTDYPGASAEQVDDEITKKISLALEGIEGARSIISESQDENSTVTVRKTSGYKLQKLLDKVRLRVDGIADLPTSIQRPSIETDGYDFPALYINLHGQTDIRTLQILSRRLKENLLAEPEISRLRIWGLHENVLRIETSPEVLRQYDLTIEDVMQRISQNAAEFKTGNLRTEAGKILLHSPNQAKFVTEYQAIPIIKRPNGTVITLGEIAQIKDTYREGEHLFLFDGTPTAGMEIQIGQKENLLHISEVAHRVVEDFRHQLPKNVDITVWGDSSNYIADRLELLQENALQGLILVVILLALFLDVRLAFWVAMGIPISVMGTLAVAGSKWVDYSLNDVTTFGFIIALGILVDDAVVVGESVFEERQRTADPMTGTENGVAKVSVATVFGVLTTIAAFYPMLLIDNPLGKVLAGFAAIVIIALIFSLLESKFILPAHLAHLSITPRTDNPLQKSWAKVQHIARNTLFSFRDRIYAPLLTKVLHYRYAAIILFLSVAILGVGLIGLGKIRTVFFPEVPGQLIIVNMQMDPRAPFQLTKTNIERIERIGNDLSRETQKRYHLTTAPFQSSFLIISNAQTASIFVELSPTDQRPYASVSALTEEWKKRVGQVEGATKLHFSGTEDLAGGFEIKLLSKDAELLAKANVETQKFLSGFQGISSIHSSLTPGQPQLDVKIKPSAYSLGFDVESLGKQISYAFGGGEVQKIYRDSTRIRVLVQNQRLQRDSIEDLMTFKLRNSNGQWIPIQDIAEITGEYTSKVIQRQNAKLLIKVSASINSKIVAPEEVGQAVKQKLIPALHQKYPSVKLTMGGDMEEMLEIQSGMKKALLLSIVLIYVLMAIPLKSYWQPFLILTIVPFGFIGAAAGHWLMGLPLSMLSFFGMLALAGVVINDGLVMVTRYNQAREQGCTFPVALRQAAIGRFQAIFLTTATTVIALLPLLTETSEQAQYLIPAAVSLAFGELFSTLLLLLLVPILIMITEDLKSFFTIKKQA